MADQSRANKKNPGSGSDFFSSAYGELRRIAAAQMSRMPPAGSTMQPTALVHEAWLRIQERQDNWQSRAHFFAAAAEAMRHVLIDRARQRRAIRHGGGKQRISIDDVEVPLSSDDDERLFLVDDAVQKLQKTHPGPALLAKLRLYAGFEISEAAQALGVPRATAYRRWTFARTWLYSELQDETLNK